MSSERLSILVLCTANRIRSPLAAATLADRLSDLPVDVFSRGTLDVGPLPPLLITLEFARQLGLDLSRHRARSVQREDLAAADVILGFEAHHLRAAREAGAAEAKLFGLVDAVELVGRIGHRPDAVGYLESARRLFAEADALRDRNAAPAEVDDPITKPRDEALALGRRVHGLAGELAGLLTPAG